MMICYHQLTYHDLHEEVIALKRKLNWGAFPGIIISLVMLIIGILFLIRPLVLTEGYSVNSLLFPLVWVGIVAFSGIRAALVFLGFKELKSRRPTDLTNLYGPGSQKDYLENVKKRYRKEDHVQEELDVTESLYQLELMKLDGTISEEEYQFIKADLIKKHQPDA